MLVVRTGEVVRDVEVPAEADPSGGLIPFKVSALSKA